MVERFYGLFTDLFMCILVVCMYVLAFLYRRTFTFYWNRSHSDETGKLERVLKFCYGRLQRGTDFDVEERWDGRWAGGGGRIGEQRRKGKITKQPEVTKSISPHVLSQITNVYIYDQITCDPDIKKCGLYYAYAYNTYIHITAQVSGMLPTYRHCGGKSVVSKFCGHSTICDTEMYEIHARHCEAHCVMNVT